jgi:hypothetical protein
LVRLFRRLRNNNAQNELFPSLPSLRTGMP